MPQGCLIADDGGLARRTGRRQDDAAVDPRCADQPGRATSVARRLARTNAQVASRAAGTLAVGVAEWMGANTVFAAHRWLSTRSDGAAAEPRSADSELASLRNAATRVVGAG